MNKLLLKLYSFVKMMRRKIERQEKGEELGVFPQKTKIHKEYNIRNFKEMEYFPGEKFYSSIWFPLPIKIFQADPLFFCPPVIHKYDMQNSCQVELKQ